MSIFKRSRAGFEFKVIIFLSWLPYQSWMTESAQLFTSRLCRMEGEELDFLEEKRKQLGSGFEHGPITSVYPSVFET